MIDIWETGRKHVKMSKLYLRALLRRGPNIFVALSWSQVFWLVLEATAGNQSSHSYVRLSSVLCYALALYTGAHFLLLRFRKNHHALEFLLDLATDVVGFAWINVAEEVLAQVFGVGAHAALLYCGFAMAASWGAMAIGTGTRDCLDWPVDFEETANRFVAGSCALPTSWLITQAVHIALYGFFYRTSARAADLQAGGATEDVRINVRFAPSLFLLVYALFCTVIAARVVEGTVAAAVVADGVTDNSTVDSGPRSHGVLRAIEAGGPFTASLASEAAAALNGKVELPRHVHHGETDRPAAARASSSLLPHPGGRRRRRNAPGESLEVDHQTHFSRAADGVGDDDVEGVGRRGRPTNRCADGNDKEAQGRFGAEEVECEGRALGEAFAVAARTRGEALRRGGKTYMRLTLGMMVGWAYNLWGQVEFRQEEIKFRYGPAIGATIYALISTTLGVCLMVRGADKLDAIGERRGVFGSIEESMDGGVLGDEVLDPDSRKALQHRREGKSGGEGLALEKAAASHAQRMLVVVGGVSLMVGWAWEEAIDLFLEDLLGDSTDLGAILAKLGLACVATMAVLGGLLSTPGGRHRDRSLLKVEGVGDLVVGNGREETQSLLMPLIESAPPDGES